MITVVLIVQAIQAAWLVVLTAAWVAQRHRHDRLMYRVGSLSKTLTKVGRVRHNTAAQAAVDAAALRLANSTPPPPFPVPPPPTSPITTTGGRHAEP